MSDSDLEQLITAARLLRPLLDELVFVGGAVTGLLITGAAANEPRATFDVDAIVEIGSYAEYAVFGERLRALGFAEHASESAPLCRWVHGGTILDVMPLDEKILGFSSRWYRAAMEAAEKRRDVAKVTSSEVQTWRIAVVDGRAERVAEVRATPAELRSFIHNQARALLDAPALVDALPGYLLPDAASQARIRIRLDRLRALASQ